jgi:hypothetical protein
MTGKTSIQTLEASEYFWASSCPVSFFSGHYKAETSGVKELCMAQRASALQYSRASKVLSHYRARARSDPRRAAPHEHQNTRQPTNFNTR